MESTSYRPQLLALAMLHEAAYLQSEHQNFKYYHFIIIWYYCLFIFTTLELVEVRGGGEIFLISLRSKFNVDNDPETRRVSLKINHEDKETEESRPRSKAK